MLEDFTLVIPTHNRHSYLDRVIEYYQSYTFNIIILDSSPTVYAGIKSTPRIIYYHLPAMSLPKKLAYGMMLVKSEYVALMADDDFLIPAAINTCIEFLKYNKSFVSAQGNALVYKKPMQSGANIIFQSLYPEIRSDQITNIEWEERMRRVFSPYRSYIWAVFRTNILQITYSDNLCVSNLFLNEYLSTLIPICFGNFAELNILYQVREWVETSDDKITPNIDLIYNSCDHRQEICDYLEYIAKQVCDNSNLSFSEVRSIAGMVLAAYAQTCPSVYKQRMTLKKQIGSLIKIIPLLGNRMVDWNRKKEIKRQMSNYVRTDEDKLHLNEIALLIQKYNKQK